MLGKKYFKLNYIVTIVLLVLTLALSFSFASNNFTTQDGIEESTAAPTYTSGSWTSSSSRYATSFAGGNGGSSSPWEISTAAQLARMSYLVNNSNSSYGSDAFELTANIDLSRYYWAPIGNEDNAFSGSFDGNGYVISGIYTKSADMYQGLFGYMDGGEISNVGIIDSNIQGFSCVGAICAYIYREGSVLNCFNKSTVYGENMQIGGIVGFAYNYRGENITIRNCYNTGSITCSTDDSRGRVGGIIGDLHGSDSYLINCFNTGYVSGSSNVGGVAGYVMQDGGTAVVTNCYNIGQVTGSSNYKGAVVGRNYHDNGTVEYCYWGGSCTLNYGLGTSSTSGGTNYDNVEKVSNITTVAKGNSWYITSSNWNSSYSWSMSSTWGINNSSTNGFNSGYPYLRVFVYNISYNRGSGSAGTYAPTTGYPGDVVRISNATAPTGYTFSGWTATNLETATAKRGSSSGSVTTAWSGTSRTTSQYFINLAGSGDTITFTAGYTAKTTSITLDKNNGSGGSSSVTATYGSVMPKITAPTRTGYTFNGYYINETNNNGTGTKYYNSDGTSARTWDVNATTDTLYAGWTIESYTINYDANGGSVSPDSDTVNYNESITLPTPTRTGYAFTGWKYGSSTITDMSYTVPDFGASGTEVTFEAQWSRESYTIEYDANGGSVSVASVDVEYGQTITLPTATQTGYTFTGWEYGGSTYTGSYTVPDFGNNGATVTFTAQWEVESYRINYDAGEGSVSPTYEDVDYNERITLPTPEPPDGYYFTGWSYGGRTYTGSYTVPDFGNDNASVTFTAQYEEETYIFYYNANGGSVTPTQQTVQVGDTIILPTPTRTGYTYLGWLFDNQGNDTPVSGSLIIMGDMGEHNEITFLTAQWSIESYRINYDAGEGSVSPTYDDVSYGNRITLPTPTRTGYTFNGWRYNSTNYTGSYTVPDFGDNGATVTFTAQWTKESYTIKYDANGGSVSPNSQTVNYGASITLPTPTPPGGYYFTGWSYGGRTYTGSYTVPDFGNNGASVTFTAQWTANKYTIIFDEVGGSEVSDIVDYTIESTITFPSTTKAGYDFVNWQVTKADGNWTNGATFNANTTTTDKYGNVTLTAQWDYHTYTVTLDPNGGEVSPTSIRVTYQSTYGSLPTPTRDGYVFKGWYTGETSGTQILSTTRYTSTQDTTIFAQWQDTWANHASDALTSEDGYYLVSSEEDLARVSYLFNCTDRTDVQTMKFKLTKNLDMSDYTWLPIGSQSRQFRGIFEGNGHIISGLNTYYNSSISSTYINIGLFGYVNGATIQNLYLRDTDMRGGSNVGGLIGYATGNTQVTSCAFDGSITANSNGGSIVGLGATSVIVSNCTVFSSNTTADTNGMARGCSVRSLVYITNGIKDYIGTDFSNYVFVEGMPAPVPTGLSWLAQGGEPCDNTKLDSWANGD